MTKVSLSRIALTSVSPVLFRSNKADRKRESHRTHTDGAWCMLHPASSIQHEACETFTVMAEPFYSFSHSWCNSSTLSLDRIARPQLVLCFFFFFPFDSFRFIPMTGKKGKKAKITQVQRSTCKDFVTLLHLLLLLIVFFFLLRFFSSSVNFFCLFSSRHQVNLVCHHEWGAHIL